MPAMTKSQATKLLGGSGAEAARALGISRQAFHKWPRKLRPKAERKVLAALDRIKTPAGQVAS